MKYRVETTSRFDTSFKKLDHYTKLIIKSWITKYLIDCEDPPLHGKALVAKHKGLWRYRIGDYRLVCSIEDTICVSMAINIGHRKDVHKKQ